MMFKVYILWSEKLQRYYVGSTNDLNDRLHRHNSGDGKYTSKGTPWKLVHFFECLDRKEAVTLENRIKARGIKRYLDDNKLAGSSPGR